MGAALVHAAKEADPRAPATTQRKRAGQPEHHHASDAGKAGQQRTGENDGLRKGGGDEHHRNDHVAEWNPAIGHISGGKGDVVSCFEKVGDEGEDETQRDQDKQHSAVGVRPPASQHGEEDAV